MDKVPIWGSENSGTKLPWNELWLEIVKADNVGIGLLSSDLCFYGRITERTKRRQNSAGRNQIYQMKQDFSLFPREGESDLDSVVET